MECGHKFKTVELDEDMVANLMNKQEKISACLDEMLGIVSAQKETFMQKLEAVSVVFDCTR